jgi:hypothetical protein
MFSSSIISIARCPTICYDNLALALGVILPDCGGHELQIMHSRVAHGIFSATAMPEPQKDA